MKKTVLALLMLALAVQLISCGGNTASDTDKTTYSADIISDMTLEEKVGQMIFARYPGGDSTKELLSKKPGGIIMFARDFEGLNADEVREKIRSLGMKIPPVIGVDEEGGTVVRVSSNPKLRQEKYKSPQEIYDSGGMDALRENTADKSRLLQSLGITMNLAPVADVSQNADDFMYDRSMGKDAEETAECIKNIVEVMNDNNILSCLKHFPGYGGTADTHKAAASDARSAEAFRGTSILNGKKTGGDFLPFKSGIEAGADSVLVSHNLVPALDSEYPASLSPEIHDILRSELSFDGVIITDDIAMGAVADIDDVYVKAVNAGNDLIITTDYNAAFDQILNAVRDGKIDEERINIAVERILKMKGLK